jgi:diadenosine tetraphosphate (Ap4A) HIT family hydrolase
MAECATCSLVARRDAGDAPPWDSIRRTPSWDIVHSYDTSLEGWLVLVARRHVTSMAELTDDEAAELGPLIKNVSQALEEVTGCVKTYVAQFAEHPDHQHVHVHVIARGPDHPVDARGPWVFSLVGKEPDERVSEARMNELAAALRETLESASTS